MNEKKLIELAESGNNVQAMLELANYYYKKSKSGNDDKVGDIISTDDFVKMLNAEEKADTELQAKAYKYFKMAAESGNANAMTTVASWLYDGIGVKKNREESDIWYRRAAKAGDPSAMRVVAFSSNDEVEKFKYYKLSGELDRPGLNKQDSIKQTAINYACGRGTKKSIEEAEKWLAKLDDEHDVAAAKIEIAQITGEKFWLEQAAETSTLAMVKLAENFISQNDFENSLVFYEKASTNGDFEATSVIGDIYYIGEGNIEQDYKKAFEYYSKASEFGYNMATIKKALMLYKGCGEIEQNLREAFLILRKVCKTREKFFGVFRYNSVAKFYLSKMYANSEGTRKNSELAWKWLKRSAAIEKVTEYESTHQVPEAMYMVAERYFSEQEFEQAAEIYKKLAEYHSISHFPYNFEAAKKLMWMYELGEGVPQDKEQAEYWRKKFQNE